MSDTDAALPNHTQDAGQSMSVSMPSSGELAGLIAAQIVRTGGRVLDVACGPGKDAVFLARCGFRVTAVDARADVVDAAKKTIAGTGVEIDFRHVASLPLPVDDGSIDLIHERGRLSQLPDDQRAPYAAELARVVQPGGAIAVFCASATGDDDSISATAMLEQYFPRAQFTHGPAVPANDTSTLVVLRKRERPLTEDASTRVTGVGGVFFKSPDTKRLQAWYERHLGVPTGNDGFVMFSWRRQDAPHRKGHTVWSPFKHDTTYFAPSDAPFMVNYRVADVRALLEKLRADGVQVMDDVEDTEYGIFGWCVDPDGNKIELWQPPDTE